MTKLIGIFVLVAGLVGLQSEAQWEFACRAGEGEGRWPSGAPYLNTEEDNGVQSRYWCNGGEESGTAIVGSYKPNAWGLYDMTGNVADWQRTATLSAATPSTAGNRLAIRLQADYALRDTYIGFRPVCKGGLR